MKYNLSFILLFVIGCNSTMISTDKREILYREKCSGCHRLYSKNEFSKEEWESKLPEMYQNANLSPDEEKLLNEFLLK